MINYFTIILVTFFLFFIQNKFADRFKIIDFPDERKDHSYPTSTMGGIIIYFVFLVSIKLFDFDVYQNAIIINAFVILCCGVIDDKYSLNVGSRLAIQIISFFLLIQSGFLITDLGYFQFFGKVFLGSFSVVFTIICIGSLVNSYNYLDGVDGAAAVNFLGTNIAWIIILSLKGIYFDLLFINTILILIFLIFNLSKNKKIKVFLGDSGSLMLGYIISGLSIYFSYIQLIIEPHLLIWTIALPVFEFISINLSRIKNNRELFKPGKDHIQYMLKTRFGLLKGNLFMMMLCLMLSAFGYFLYNMNIIGEMKIFSYLVLFTIYFLTREKILNK